MPDSEKKSLSYSASGGTRGGKVASRCTSVRIHKRWEIIGRGGADQFLRKEDRESETRLSDGEATECSAERLS